MATPEANNFYQTLFERIPKGEITLAKMRLGLENLLSEFPAASDVHFETFDIGKLPAAWVHAPGCTRDNVILFLHGGGYTAGSFHSHQDLIGRLAKATGCYVLAVDYRVAPEHLFPAALEDAQKAYNFLLLQQSPTSKIFLAGTSAGGGLLLSLMLKLRAEGEKLPAAGILLSPWVDLAMTGKTLKTHDGQDIIKKDRLKAAIDAYLQGHDPKDPYVSPLYGDLHGLPPLLIQAGTREILLDEIERLAKKAQESGVQVQLQEFDDMIHTWQLFAAKIPEGREAIDKVGEFVKGLE